MKKAFVLFSLTCVSLLTDAADQKAPNILWVLTDDHRADSVQAYNRAVSGRNYSPLGYVMSPAADRLAEEGVLFTRAYCNSPGCAPSRTSMHYGQYPHQSGHYGFEYSHQQTPFAKKFLPTMMSERGYETVLFGKSGYYVQKFDGKRMKKHQFYQTEVTMRDMFNNKVGDWSKNPVFGDGKKQADIVTWNFPDGPVDVVYPAKGERTPEQEATKQMVAQKLDLMGKYGDDKTAMVMGGVSPSSTEKTIDGVITSSMEQFLANPGNAYKTSWGDQHTGPNTDKPLFIHLGYHFPHTPILPSKEYRDIFMSKEQEIPYRIPEFSKDELKTLPPQLQKWFEKTNFADHSTELKKQSIRDYYAFCAMGDELIGNAVESFKQYSEEVGREWLILYVIGDHGWHLGEQGGSSKFAPYDTSNHCAVIAVSSNKAKWPAGKVCHDWVEFVDFVPTILKESGANLSTAEYAHLDGIPMDEILTGQNTREYTIGEFNHVIGPRVYLRCEDFAFSMRNRETNGKPGEKWGQKPGEDIKWGLEAPREDVEMTLFDLRNDSMEQVNVANDPRYIALADWFRNKLGRITLGDGRVECDWKKGAEDYVISNFAEGAHDGKLSIPSNLIPKL